MSLTHTHNTAEIHSLFFATTTYTGVAFDDRRIAEAVLYDRGNVGVAIFILIIASVDSTDATDILVIQRCTKEKTGVFDGVV